jgi:phosphoribosyl 1,2-cyclic phosphate phosphodiesterase
MNLLLLGTSAAEGWPAPFCDCRHCEEARRRGGPNIRSRSGALIDNDLKVDWSADTVTQMQRVRRSLSGLRTLLFTHQHVDHIVPLEMLWMQRPFTQTPPAEPIEVYGNRHVIEMVRHGPVAAQVTLHEVNPFAPFTTVTGYEVLPLAANHVEDSLLYRITRHGRSLLYGHDSGLYPAETFEALSQGPRLNAVLMECSGGARKTDNKWHLDIDGVGATIEELRRRNAVAPGARFIATHFSHNGTLCHEELCAVFLPHGVETAFDGISIMV